jgi:predicted transcriptional regulator/DNA-binding XRE family transcriptional regulator
VAPDVLMFGQQLKHFRRMRGMTLHELGDKVGRPASYLSQLENGRREPRLSTVSDLAAAMGCSTAELLDHNPPNRRAALEVKVAQIQDDPRFVALRLPYLRPTARTDDAQLEQIVALWELNVDLSAQLARRPSPPAAGARAVNTAMRIEMRSRDNYYSDIEKVAETALGSLGQGGRAPVSERALADLTAYFGFSVSRVQDLPASARSVSDLRNRVIYVPQRNDVPTRSARSLIAQTLGHFALGHRDPTGFEEYVRQRVEANYFAGALLAPERIAVPILSEAKARSDISVEDLAEVFFISYEMAAHRLTNLITHHLNVPVHFTRSDAEGVLWKAYENDGVPLPMSEDGTIEGQQVCAYWGARQAFDSEDTFASHNQLLDTPVGRYWCITRLEPDQSALDAVSVGTTASHARWFRGGDTTRLAVSGCPSPDCCRQPSAEARSRWEGSTWTSARDRSHFVSGLPTDAASFSAFPGVDLRDVYAFLDRHDPDRQVPG